MTKNEWLEAVRERRVVFAGRKYTKDGWTHFMPYVVQREYDPNTEMLVPVIIPEASYWNEKAHDYQCNAWGTNRILEIFLSIGYALGADFDEMKPQVSSLL